MIQLNGLDGPGAAAAAAAAAGKCGPVSEDYYKQNLVYESPTERMRNTQALLKPVEVKLKPLRG